MRCSSCDSIRHLLADCPDSYESLRKFRSIALKSSRCRKGGDEESRCRVQKEEESFFTVNLIGNLAKMTDEKGEVEDIMLFSGRNKLGGDKRLGGVRETLGCLVLDSGCSKNVAGEGWWNSYKAGLPKNLRDKVKERRSGGKRFRLGGDEVLTSTKVVKFPATIAGRLVSMESHIIKSRIPLLWSRPSMKKAGTVIDLNKDKAKICGQWVNLN